MKASKGEIETEELEDLKLRRLNNRCNLQITPLSTSEPTEDDLKEASFANNDATPKGVLDICQSKQLVLMGNTKGFSILSTTNLYKKLRDADNSVLQAYAPVWVHTKQGIPTYVKFLPNGERILVAVRNKLLVYEISQVFEKRNQVSPIFECELDGESITRLAINPSPQNPYILIVLDSENVHLLNPDLTFKIDNNIQGSAVGFIGDDVNNFCIGLPDGRIKKYDIDGNEIFTFPTPVEIQTKQVQLVEFGFVDPKTLISLHFDLDDDLYWLTYSTIKEDEICYYSSSDLVFPPFENPLEQHFFINQIPNMLPENHQFLVMTFSFHTDALYFDIECSENPKVTTLNPNEKFLINHPMIEFHEDSDSFPVGQILDISVQDAIPNPGSGPIANISPRPIITILNTYGQCYAYDVLFEDTLKDQQYEYKMIDSKDYFSESGHEELSDLKWGIDIPEGGFPESAEITSYQTQQESIDEADVEAENQKDYNSSVLKAEDNKDNAAGAPSQLTKESDYSFLSSKSNNEGASDASSAPKASSSESKEGSTKDAIISDDSQPKLASDAANKTTVSPSAIEFQTKLELPKVQSSFEPSAPLETRPTQPSAQDEEDEEDVTEPEPRLFEWPSLPEHPVRPESPKHKETKEHIASMIINLFKDKFNERLNTVRPVLKQSGDQITSFRDDYLSSSISIGEHESQDVTQWYKELNNLIQSIKSQQSESSKWTDQVTSTIEGWKQLNRFHQYFKNQTNELLQKNRIQFNDLTPDQIREYSKMNQWNEACNYLINQTEELLARLEGKNSSQSERVPTIDQIKIVMGNIDTSAQAIQDKLSTLLLQIEALQIDMIQSNNKYFPLHFIPNQRTIPTNKENSLHNLQISEAGKKLAQIRQSKSTLKSQLFEQLANRKVKCVGPMVKGTPQPSSLAKWSSTFDLGQSQTSQELAVPELATPLPPHRSSESYGTSSASFD